MVKVILCPCGFAMRAESEEELVAAAQTHARQHGMELTSEHALTMARPEYGETANKPWEVQR